MCGGGHRELAMLGQHAGRETPNIYGDWFFRFRHDRKEIFDLSEYQRHLEILSTTFSEDSGAWECLELAPETPNYIDERARVAAASLPEVSFQVELFVKTPATPKPLDNIFGRFSYKYGSLTYEWKIYWNPLIAPNLNWSNVRMIGAPFQFFLTSTLLQKYLISKFPEHFELKLDKKEYDRFQIRIVDCCPCGCGDPI